MEAGPKQTWIPFIIVYGVLEAIRSFAEAVLLTSIFVLSLADNTSHFFVLVFGVDCDCLSEEVTGRFWLKLTLAVCFSYIEIIVVIRLLCCTCSDVSEPSKAVNVGDLWKNTKIVISLFSINVCFRLLLIPYTRSEVKLYIVVKYLFAVVGVILAHFFVRQQKMLVVRQILEEQPTVTVAYSAVHLRDATNDGGIPGPGTREPPHQQSYACNGGFENRAPPTYWYGFSAPGNIGVNPQHVPAHGAGNVV